MNGLNELRKAVNSFNEKYPRPEIKLVISKVYDLKKEFSDYYPSAKKQVFMYYSTKI